MPNHTGKSLPAVTAMFQQEFERPRSPARMACRRLGEMLRLSTNSGAIHTIEDFIVAFGCDDIPLNDEGQPDQTKVDWSINAALGTANAYLLATGLEQIEKSIDRYLVAMDTADRTQSDVA